MENVINVNIGRVSFVLNLEAYTILEKYLKELLDHYKSSSYGEEIMEDIESRIAELLLEKYSKDEVVNSQRIEEIIAIMGQPSDYYASEENEERDSDNKSSASAESSSWMNRFRCSCMILAPMETPSSGVMEPSVQISRMSLS